MTPWDYKVGVQYLVRHKPSGIYYGRVRFGRRIVRRSLGTDNLSSAKEILPHFLIAARSGVSADNLSRAAVELPEDLRMLDATTIWMRRMAEDPQLSSATVSWRGDLVKALRASWPNWDSLKVDEVRPDFVRTWAAKLHATGISATYYNALVSTGKMILDVASELVALDHSWKNPFLVCKKLGVKLGHHELPEPAQFRAFLNWIDQQPAAAEAAKLCRLLAFCGLRIQEAGRVEWRHFDWTSGELFVYGAKGRRASSDSDTRRVPLIREALDYFRPLSEAPHLRPTDRVEIGRASCRERV
jgi:integrase